MLQNQTDTQSEQPLKPVLGGLDMLVLLLFMVLFITEVNRVQFGGPASFVYWIIGFVFFLFPSTYVIRWLAQCMPGQGGPYLWIKRIFGPRLALVAAFSLWVPGALALLSATYHAFLFLARVNAQNTSENYFVGMTLVLIMTTAITCLPLRWLIKGLLVLLFVYLAAFLLIGAAGAWWLISGQTSAVPLNEIRLWEPDKYNVTILGIIIVALFGIHFPMIVGGEVNWQKQGIAKTTRFFWWGAIIIAIAYLVATFGIMVVTPPQQAHDFAEDVLLVQRAFGPLSGLLAQIALAIGHIGEAIVILLLTSRLLLSLASERILPPFLTRMSRSGVPVNSIIAQAICFAILTFLLYIAAPEAFLYEEGGMPVLTEVSLVLLTIALLTWSFSTVFVLWGAIRLLSRRGWEANLYHITGTTVSLWQRRWLLFASGLAISACLMGLFSVMLFPWLPPMMNSQRWIILISGTLVLAAIIGWLSSELPRVHALLGEQRLVYSQELILREQLQQAYNEQRSLVVRQQELLQEVNRLYEEQAQVAITDPVTGLPNHRAVMGNIENFIVYSQSGAGICAIVFVDLDRFKYINDSWGHITGDAILREFATRLRNALRPEDFIGRYGGEEFAIVLPNCDIDCAAQTAERLRQIIEVDPYNLLMEETTTTVPIHVTASIGVAVYGVHGTTREDLIERADRAMYRAKRTGRNRVCIADIDMQEDSALLAYSQPIEESILHTLLAVLAARDQGSYEHLHRIAGNAVETARILQRSEEELHLTRLGALLHDIGKLAIPDPILRKPGPLTADEWIIMRRHPEIGSKILSKVGGIFATLAHIVIAHHERWDGLGYPRGLKEEEIPMPARIVSVVDSFDAMTSRRIYKAHPLSLTDAKKELLRCAGSQYDPAVVTAFLQLQDMQRSGKRRLFSPSLRENAPLPVIFGPVPAKGVQYRQQKNV